MVPTGRSVTPSRPPVPRYLYIFQICETLFSFPLSSDVVPQFFQILSNKNPWVRFRFPFFHVPPKMEVEVKAIHLLNRSGIL